MGSQKPAKPDAEQIATAESFWNNFMLFGKYGVYATVVVLILMAIFLV